jgi:hypothetical protein
LGPGKIRKAWNEVVRFKGAKNKFKAGIIVQDEVRYQILGQDWSDMAITDGRITRLPDDDERLRVAMTQTTHFEYAALQISVLNNFLHCLQNIECAGGPPTGCRTDQDDRCLVVPKILPMGLGPFSYLIEDGRSNWLNSFFQLFALSFFSFLS